MPSASAVELLDSDVPSHSDCPVRTASVIGHDVVRPSVSLPHTAEETWKSEEAGKLFAAGLAVGIPCAVDDLDMAAGRTAYDEHVVSPVQRAIVVLARDEVAVD